MRIAENRGWTRRATLGGLAAGAGFGLAGLGRESRAEEPPPEVTRIRVLRDPKVPAVCRAPQYLAFELLRMEGFTEVVPVAWEPGQNESHMLGEGTIDVTAAVATDLVFAADQGRSITVLGGLHAGCIEMFAQTRIQQLKDLRGARIISTHEGGVEYIFMSAALAYIGLDPTTDVEWIYETDYAKWIPMFVEDKVVLINAFAPLTYDLYETGVGHVLVNTTLDDPWRNFFCCMIAANAEFARDYPVATKRALRAFAKAQQLCTADKEGVARRLVELGATPRLDYARRLLRELRYGSWHTYDPAATLRFYALRLREAGLIEGSPGEFLRHGADFSFLDQLRREMKL